MCSRPLTMMICIITIILLTIIGVIIPWIIIPTNFGSTNTTDWLICYGLSTIVFVFGSILTCIIGHRYLEWLKYIKQLKLEKKFLESVAIWPYCLAVPGIILLIMNYVEDPIKSSLLSATSYTIDLHTVSKNLKQLQK